MVDPQNGIVSVSDIRARITRSTATPIWFSGYDGNATGWHLTGTVDRITGSFSALQWLTRANDSEKWVSASAWDLVCRPTKRLF